MTSTVNKASLIALFIPLLYKCGDDDDKQGNYSLRRPPKLIIPQAVILMKAIIIIIKALRKDELLYAY